jgi:hypothetical protein
MKELCVGYIPWRKRPCLYVIEENVVRVLAHFKGSDALEEFLKMNPTYRQPGPWEIPSEEKTRPRSSSQEGVAGM